MHTGKEIRLKRIFRGHGKRCVLVPMDHGVTYGPLAGLEDLGRVTFAAAAGGADAVLMHKGMVETAYARQDIAAALVVHLSGATTFASGGGNSKVLVGTVEEAVKMGADAVSIHVTLGDQAEADMLRDFGLVSGQAAAWGMPLLAMVYARAPHIADSLAPGIVGHSMRLAAELGADMVKVPFSKAMKEQGGLIENCPIPVLIAGGEKMHSDRDLLQFAHDGVSAGAAGLSIGRNVFQHSDPGRIIAALCAVVHDGASVDEALEMMRPGAKTKQGC